MFINSIRGVSPFVVFLCLIVTSCVKDTVTEQELRKYVQEERHGLLKKEIQGKNEVSVAFRPADLLVAQELNGSADTVVLNKLKLKYANHYYFVLSIKQDGKEALTPGQMDNQEFSDVLQTVSFRMGEHLNMTTGKDTIALADYAFSRTFGMAGSTDILLAFEKEKTNNQPYIQINLYEFGLGLGHQSFRFEVSDLLNTPHIRFN